MLKKLKHWLETPDDYDGLTGWDAITLAIVNILAWGIPLALIAFERSN